jgi:hypothetical protein
LLPCAGRAHVPENTSAISRTPFLTLSDLIH